MNEQLDNHIKNSIKAYYKSRLAMPLFFIAFLILIAILYPVKSLIFPSSYHEGISLDKLYENNEKFVIASLNDLYFTGYTKEFLGYTNGYYYYTLVDGDCLVVLLNPRDCDQGMPIIDKKIFNAEILSDSTSMDVLLSSMAEDLNWTKNGITNTFNKYMLSEPDATSYIAIALKVLIIALSLYTAISLTGYILYIIFPSISPAVRKLSVYGNRRKLLKEAEKELATLPQLATDDMFITEHFFIETSSYGVAIVPISEIVWIYKYSTLHKFLWHHFSISYTLRIVANKRVHIHCPKNTKTDIDGIMDYLAEANHSILVGFSEENRIKVESIQGDTIAMRKLLAFLSKRV